MNIKQWFKALFTPRPKLVIQAHHRCSDLETAQMNADIHLAVWGNEIIDLVDFTTRIGPRHVLGLTVNHPEMLKNPSMETRRTIQTYFLSLDFIWDNQMFILDNGVGLPLVYTDVITPYHKLAPA